MEPSQIYLITPRHIDLDSFPEQLAEAMEGGPIAALLIDCDEKQDSALQKIVQILTPMAQKKDIAVLLRGDSRIAGRCKCDGLHLDGTIEELTSAIEDVSDNFMLGAQGGNKRHIAMEIGESGIDYIMFGRLEAPATGMIHDKAFDMADWWSSLFEVPAVVIGGTDLEECTRIGEAGIEFIALREAIWDHEQGPRAAIRQATSLLEASASLEPEGK